MIHIIYIKNSGLDFLYEKVRKTDSAKINFSMNLPKESLYFFYKVYVSAQSFCISYLIVLTILIIYILHVRSCNY